MKGLILKKGYVEEVELSLYDIKESEERQAIKNLESSLKPSDYDLADAEFELKLITKLTEWGIL